MTMLKQSNQSSSPNFGNPDDNPVLQEIIKELAKLKLLGTADKFATQVTDNYRKIMWHYWDATKVDSRLEKLQLSKADFCV